MNNLKVFTLMAALTALLGVLGSYFGGQSGMVTMLVISALMNFVMYFASSAMVLRMYRAQVVDAAQAPELYAMVDRLRQRAGLPMPTVAIAPHEQPNAFATGRSPEKSVVCVTAGLLKIVQREELEGVIAHELAHIKNRDMLLQTIAATMAGAISNVAYAMMFFGGRDDDNANPIASIIMIVVAPIAAAMIQFAISRQREFKADAVGAQITGRPLELASALQKLETYSRRIPMHVAPAAAPLAQVNPLAATASGFAKLFSTHPPMAERIERLRALA
ncbi:MAG TPA: zinc metalloprotease HtpX [Gemmatimonadaceae bacterium]|nr:zinc metalloprotease HtpX [Gemmatimonadaceae bacterium]